MSLPHYTNAEIAASEGLWNDYFNVNAFAENEFSLFTYEERLAMLNASYPERS